MCMCISGIKLPSNQTCEELDTDEYLKIVWTAAAELPGIHRPLQRCEFNHHTCIHVL